jgi:hypothetical protein
MDLASLARLAEQLGGDDGAVFEINAPTVRAFLWVATQWRTALEPHGFSIRTRWIGLDYQGASIAFTAAGIALDAELLWRLQVMEDAAVAAMNARSAE